VKPSKSATVSPGIASPLSLLYVLLLSSAFVPIRVGVQFCPPLTLLTARFAAGGVNGVTLADTVGFADPRTVARTVAAVGDATGIPLSLHLHDAHGYALANVYAGLEAGVRSFEGALAGLGGCPWAPGAPGNLDLFVIGFDNHVWSTFWNDRVGWN